MPAQKTRLAIKHRNNSFIIKDQQFDLPGLVPRTLLPDRELGL
jgi:hypothetical protein